MWPNLCETKLQSHAYIPSYWTPTERIWCPTHLNQSILYIFKTPVPMKLVIFSISFFLEREQKVMTQVEVVRPIIDLQSLKVQVT